MASFRCHCNPDHNKFSSLSNSTVVAIFPKLCLWRRSLCSNLGGTGLEKLYRATLIGSLPWSRHLWFYDRGRLGRVEIITLSVGVRAKKGEGEGGGEDVFSSFSLPPLPLTRPISSSLQEFQHGALVIKTVRSRPMKMPALQAIILEKSF